MGAVEHDSTYDAAAPALLKMERAAIAAASHITYHPPELLALIKDHLCAAGLAESAAVLDRESAHQERSALEGLQTSHSAFPGPPPSPGFSEVCKIYGSHFGNLFLGSAAVLDRNSANNVLVGALFQAKKSPAVLGSSLGRVCKTNCMCCLTAPVVPMNTLQSEALVFEMVMLQQGRGVGEGPIANTKHNMSFAADQCRKRWTQCRLRA